MPELPEVETMCRGIAGAVGGRIVGLTRPRSRLRPIEILPSWPALTRRLVGRGIERVGRLGKRVVLHFDSGDALVIEPRMTGLVLACDPPNRSHLRLVIDLAGARSPQVLFWDQRGLGVVRLLTAEQLAARVDRSLGPDALTATAVQLRRQFASTRVPIKVALLDQRRLAGVGNLYASEILFHARVHPALPCGEVSEQQWSAIASAMRRVLAAAVKHEGSTLADGTYRVGREATGGYQRFHRVYQRKDEPCFRCQMPIVRIVQAQRSTFFCPACQAIG